MALVGPSRIGPERTPLTVKVRQPVRSSGCHPEFSVHLRSHFRLPPPRPSAVVTFYITHWEAVRGVAFDILKCILLFSSCVE